jgi:uncharacterized lipoprotein YddW (UPF0748 family)
MASALAGAKAVTKAGVLPVRPAFRNAPELVADAPAAPREFRAAWVATVANIDWPSRKGLSSAEQQTEMHAILDRAVALRLNAIILQVRTSADALYPSKLEPWSEYLSGTQGQPPQPLYDPLALWIAQAHARGLELHAWFNPFRARQSKAASATAKNHVSQTRPAWVKAYGDQLWMDPGEKAAADHTLAVFMDVLRRYDVDGIHIDDYFYPYPISQGDEAKTEIDFPDQPSWQRYQSGGKLSREDWRRSNVDALVERIYQGIRKTKPWVRFGVSPFGLGKPELRPEGIQGFSQYHKLYADVERWLQQGWMDYLVPQLYWRMEPKEQAFVPLLDYWHRQNTKGRHVWAGLFTSRITVAAPVPAAPALPASASAPEARPGWLPEEIMNQIAAVRARAPGSGHVHFSMVALMQNRLGVADALRGATYQDAALVPASPWLEASTPQAPLLQIHAATDRGGEGAWQLQLQRPRGSKVAERWAVWLRFGAQWSLQVAVKSSLDIAPRDSTGQVLTGVVVSAIDRVGKESPRVGFAPRDEPAQGSLR